MAAKAKLMVTADANIKPFKAKMQEAKKDGLDVADEISQKNKEAISSLLDYASPVMMLIAAVGALGGAFAKMAERGDELRKGAREMGVSVGTMAELNARARAANIPLEEMNELFGKLKDGKMTLDELRESLGGVGDKAKYASEMMANFTAIQTSKNVEQIGKISENLSAWISEKALDWGSFGREARMGNVYAPHIQAMAEAGESKETIKFSLRHRYGVAKLDKDLEAYINSVVSTVATMRKTEEFAAETKVLKNLAKDIGDSEEARRQYNEMYHKNISQEEFDRRTKEDESPYQKAVRVGKENKKALDEEIKAQEELDKKEKERAKIELGYAYTKGGGILAGLRYGVNFGSAQNEEKEDRKEVKDGVKDIRASLKVAEGFLGETVNLLKD